MKANSIHNYFRFHIIKKIVNIGLLLITTLMLSCSDNDEDMDPAPGPEPETPGSEQDPDNIPLQNGLVGTLFSFQKDLRQGLNYKRDDENTTYYNVPLFEVVEGTEDGWWDNLVEEAAYSGIDYFAANCRGRQPSYPAKDVDHGDPTHLKDLIEAMERRGVTEEFKIAIFDDCPSSWEAARNYDLGRGYAGYSESNPGDRLPYPLKDIDIEVDIKEFQDSVYQYIWDYNIRLAFQTIPEKYLFKYNDRPVVFFWGCGFVGDVPGKLTYILQRIREDCIKEFGMDPLLIIDQDWQKRDNTLTAAGGVINGINNWFTIAEPYTVRDLKGLTVGCGLPGFSINDKKGENVMFLDADHGRLLEDAFRYFADFRSDLIFLEGFTDVLENAAFWRSTDETFYDFPNQRLNILRKWSSSPYPKEFKVEAEACDYYEDKSTGNSGGQYRIGDLDIKKCDDTYKGWCVTDTEAGEWLKWVELPYRSGTSTIRLRYSSQNEAKIRIDVGGKEGMVVNLPATSGTWSDCDIATVTFETRGWQETVLHIISGNVNLNYFTIVGESK